MAQPITIKGGKVRILLAPDGVTYSAPCGFTSKSINLNKGLTELNIPDCDDPDEVDWVGRDATSLSMSVSGEGVLASESVETWLDAWENVDSIAAKIEWEFPSKLITWTGRMHVESLESTAANGARASMTVSMQSDGEMIRTVA